MYYTIIYTPYVGEIQGRAAAIRPPRAGGIFTGRKRGTAKGERTKGYL